jgi:hypothetical protein
VLGWVQGSSGRSDCPAAGGQASYDSGETGDVTDGVHDGLLGVVARDPLARERSVAVSLVNHEVGCQSPGRHFTCRLADTAEVRYREGEGWVRPF